MYERHIKRQACFARLRAVAVLSMALAIGAAGCRSNPVSQPDDAALTQSVQAKIAGDSSLGSEPIQASVLQGVATLTGTVSSDAARSLAANDAAQVAGIRTVVNDLTVQAAAMVAPASPPATREANHRERSARQQKPSASVARPQPEPAPVQETPAPVERQSAAPEVRPANPVPVRRSMTLPADTTVAIRITQTLDSATTQQGDTFSGVLASDIVEDGVTVLPQGTPVSGRVVAVQEAAHFKGSSLLTIELTSIDRRSEHLPITTDSYSKEGNGRGKNTAEKIGGGAAVGAILGGIFGGGKGAAIGAAAGGRRGNGGTGRDPRQAGADTFGVAGAVPAGEPGDSEGLVRKS